MNWLQPSSIPRAKVYAGSACLLAMVPVEWVQSFPAINPTTQMLQGSITLQPGRSWLRCILASQAIPLKEESQRNSAGLYWQINISGRTVGHSAPIHNYLNNFPHHRWLVLYKEAGTGITYAIGHPDSPAQIAVSYSNENGTINAISISRTSMHRSMVYRGTFTLDNSVTIDASTANGVAYYVATGTEGNSFIPAQNLRGRTILWVSRSGMKDLLPVYTTPANDMEIQYISTTNTLVVHPDYPLAAGETFFILYS